MTRFEDALLWMAHSGGRWRDLPAERFGAISDGEAAVLSMNGALDGLFEAVSREPDLEWLMIDANIIRAHIHAAGARRKRGPDVQGLGRSRAVIADRAYEADNLMTPSLIWAANRSFRFNVQTYLYSAKPSELDGKA